MKITDYYVSSIADNEWKDYAMYTIQERAIPSIMDGLKPVQRFVLYSALKSASTDFKKVTAIGGIVSEYGYNHGESSAQEACSLMSNTWSNNYPILEGRGNFGSRQVQEAAATRYIFCRVHDNFRRLFKDNEVAPVHPKEEYYTPRYYLPVLPFVLMNGVKGIATGYGTDILPHSFESIKNCVKQVLDTGRCEEPEIKFPKFVGKIVFTDTEKYIEGLYELESKTKLLITEIPVKFDRVKYVQVLDKLVELDQIVGYDELRGANEFTFRVTLKRDFEMDHEGIVKMFKLRQPISQNINVIGPNDELLHYDRASDLIKDFVKFREPFIQKRIEHNIESTKRSLELANAKVEFIQKVISGALVVQGKSRKQLVQEIESYPGMCEYANELSQMSIYSMTTDEVQKLSEQAAKASKEHEFWVKTTVKKQFALDLKDL